jgi:HK97 family phage portal protein
VPPFDPSGGDLHLEILGYELIARKTAGDLRPVNPASGRGGWYNVATVREPYTGAWQQNAEIPGDTALSYFAVFACVTLIAADIAKLHLRLVQQDREGIWTEATNPAYSPVLRKPNRYQTIQKCVEQWITSKLVHGNTYVLKERDQRQVVRALYVLDPKRVTPMVAPDGAVYYELRRDDLAGLYPDSPDTGAIVVPASEIIHDLMVPLFHPLIGVTPLYACGLAATQGITIQQTSQKFFAGGSNPGGVLTAPGAIGDDTAKRLKDYWDTNFTGANVGKVAVLGDGLKYEAMTVNAADAQLIEQLKWTADTICSCFHIPPFMIGVGPPPPYANVEPMLQQYHAQCLQTLITSLEMSLDEGLGLPGTTYGTEFDLDDLIWLDTATKTKAAADAIGSGAMSPNEARRKYFGLGSVKGGDTPYMQVQNYSLRALDARDQTDPLVPQPPPPAPAPVPPPTLPPPDDDPDDDDDADDAADKRAVTASLALALLRKDWAGLSNGI